MTGNATAAEARRTDELVAIAAEVDAAIARLEARRSRALAEAYAISQAQTDRLRDASTREREMPLRAMAAEFAVPARVSDRTMQTRLFDAHRIVTRFPAAWTAWHEGRLSGRHVQVIVDAGANLIEPERRSAFEREVVEYGESTSAARLRSFAEQVAEKYDPHTMQDRHDDAVQGRRVWVEDLRDGMSMLGAIGPSAEIHGTYDRLTRQGRALKAADRAARREAADREGAGSDAATPEATAADALTSPPFDERTLDQMRADLLLDMLLTATPTVDPTADAVEGGLAAIRAQVQVTIPATSLTGSTQGGAMLDGTCAVDPKTVQILTGNAPGFDRVFLDPVSAAVLAVDRRSATAAQRRFLTARDVRCRFPGCRTPARTCEWDHREDYALGGRTDVENLGAFCKRHHTLKHVAGWTVVQHPGGRLHFTSPLGRSYIEDPPRTVMFTPDTENAPF
ncbi:DUF222 domain-containing protein [Microbacterium sp. SSW1-59]|uniref:HNH endonuclease signature motif containing protein n=1 Tax=Microbacterium xanthum TaxID=3079794 RepID=UPI002AD3AF2E|nr:DUF222 domain-containing protein [Microbacterium sp. SSW1-59]MDZ8202679.1 DUF222 domain-containing protein [Microbacterium sp. SSW1-59]